MKNNGNSFKGLFIFLAALLVVLFLFVRKVMKAGRLKEFFISTPILFVIYFLLYNSFKYIDFMSSLSLLNSAFIYSIPITVYSFYWMYLFSCEKVTSPKANLNWADINWWWKLDGWEFEEEVARVFRLNGYKAKVTKKTGDGGVDIIMYKGNKKYLVQCKHYTNPVPVEVLRALNGVREDFGADELILVASSGITMDGYSFINNKPYFKIYTLEDIIAMGLRPHEASEEIPQENDIIDVEIVENFKSITSNLYKL